MLKSYIFKLSAIAATLVLTALTGCATSHVMIGQARPAISTDEVRLYLRPPAQKYQEIASLKTSSRGSLAFSAQDKTDVVIERLKAEAARLGANAVLLHGVSDQQTKGGGQAGVSGGVAIYVERPRFASMDVASR